MKEILKQNFILKLPMVKEIYPNISQIIILIAKLTAENSRI